MLEKSEGNAVHDGREIQGPLLPAQLRVGKVYQRIIDNRTENGLFEDLRVVVIQGEVPLCLPKAEDRGKFDTPMRRQKSIWQNRPKPCFLTRKWSKSRHFRPKCVRISQNWTFCETGRMDGFTAWTSTPTLMDRLRACLRQREGHGCGNALLSGHHSGVHEPMVEHLCPERDLLQFVGGQRIASSHDNSALRESIEGGVHHEKRRVTVNEGLLRDNSVCGVCSGGTETG